MDFGTDRDYISQSPDPHHICTFSLVYRWTHKIQGTIVKISHPPQPFPTAPVSVPPIL